MTIRGWTNSKHKARFEFTIAINGANKRKMSEDGDLPTISEDEDEPLVKAKSTKTKKKKKTTIEGDVVKKTKKKKSSAASSASEGKSAVKPKSIKKKKKSTVESSDDEAGATHSPSPSPTSSLRVGGSAADPLQRRPSNEGAAQRRRSSGGRGVPPSPGGRAPRRPQSMMHLSSPNRPPNSPRTQKAQVALSQSSHPKVPSSSSRRPSNDKGTPTMVGLDGSVHPPGIAGQRAPMGGRGMSFARGRGRGRGRSFAARGRGRGRQAMSMKHVSGGRASMRPPPPLSRNESANPTSILRSSSHHRPSTRINPDGSLSTVPVTSKSSFEEDNGVDEERPIIDRLPSTLRMGGTSTHSATANSPSGLGGLGASARFGGLAQMKSMGKSALGSMGTSFRNKTTLSQFASTRSILTNDQEFLDDPAWKRFLRYIRILPPNHDEKPIKRNIRLMTWAALFCDFLAALVSITTYNGVTYCCDQPILNIAGDIDWHLAIRITTYVYLVMIFAEILPVIREGFPFNLLNPLVGFLITFAVFFDDRILEAVIMWIIEVSAVTCEFAVYRLKIRLFNQREERLRGTDDDLKELKRLRRKRKLQRAKEANGEDDSSDEESSESSFAKDTMSSFHDESQFSEESLKTEQYVDLSNRRELRLMRDRRILRQTQSEEQRHLRYHFFGVAFNVFLVSISLTVILCIGRSGGLCIRDMEPPNVFKNNQLEKCFDCKETNGECEVCRDDGTSHCYYPYY